MDVHVLGCSGGVGGGRRTTALRVGERALIDCGTGVGDLDVTDLCKIDEVFLTHSHLDHIALLPMLADLRIGRRADPLIVYGLPETLAALRESVFNGRIWPDYTAQPTADHPIVRLEELRPNETVAIEAGSITALPACHSVPAAGYAVHGHQATLVFSGDTTFCPSFWTQVNALPDLRYLLLETTFLDDNDAGCVKAGHTNARLLAESLAELRQTAEIWITHMEPERERETMSEVMARAAPSHPHALNIGTRFSL